MRITAFHFIGWKDILILATYFQSVGMTPCAIINAPPVPMEGAQMLVKDGNTMEFERQRKRPQCNPPL